MQGTHKGGSSKKKGKKGKRNPAPTDIPLSKRARSASKRIKQLENAIKLQQDAHKERMILYNTELAEKKKELTAIQNECEHTRVEKREGNSFICTSCLKLVDVKL